jgi:hypothetical protein
MLDDPSVPPTISLTPSKTGPSAAPKTAAVDLSKPTPIAPSIERKNATVAPANAVAIESTKPSSIAVDAGNMKKTPSIDVAKEREGKVEPPTKIARELDIPVIPIDVSDEPPAIYVASKPKRRTCPHR